MTKIKAQLASNNIDSQGDVFTDECLQDMADQINKIGILITSDFNLYNAIGRITNAKVEDGKLLVEGEIDNSVLNKDTNLYIVPKLPCASRRKTEKGREIQNIDLYCTGIVTDPTDQTLLPIEIVEEKQDDWISVDEKLPETEKTVLVYNKKFDEIVTAKLYKSIERWSYTGAVSNEDYSLNIIYSFSLHDKQITHWKPLPDKPKIKNLKNKGEKTK